MSSFFDPEILTRTVDNYVKDVQENKRAIANEIYN
jgi:hypothetical protein